MVSDAEYAKQVIEGIVGVAASELAEVLSDKIHKPVHVHTLGRRYSDAEIYALWPENYKKIFRYVVEGIGFERFFNAYSSVGYAWDSSILDDMRRKIPCGKNPDIEGGEVLIAGETIFPANRPSPMPVILGADRLAVGLDILINDKPGMQTIVDFDHDAVHGCVLQYQAGKDGGNGELAWYAAGASIVAQVSTERWLRVWLTVDIANRTIAMRLNKDKILNACSVGDIFPRRETRLGIGNWLRSPGREFCGCIRNLWVRGIALSSSPKNKWMKFLESLFGSDSSQKQSGTFDKKPADLFKLTFFESEHSDITDLEVLPCGFSGLAQEIKEYVRYVDREDVIGAAFHIRQILDAGYSVAAALSSDGALQITVASGEEGEDDLHLMATALLNMNLYKFRGQSYYALLSVLAACAHALYRRGKPREAANFLNDYQKRFGQCHALADIHHAQNYPTEVSGTLKFLVTNMASGGLDYQQVLRGCYCQAPYDTFEVRSDGDVFVCCPSYLPISIGNIYRAKSPSEIMKSKTLRKILDSIENQDFRYCRWLQCRKFGRLPVRPEIPKTEYKPVTFNLSYDKTCNLWCTTCRKEKIVVTGTERDRLLRLTEEIILPLLATAETCMLSGYGDIFASRACRRILDASNRIRYPNLKFKFITNAILLTETEWNKFPGIHDMVNSIRVSIDAASKPVYEQIRLGGKWDILQANLDFIADLRKKGVIQEFMISFTIQACNVHEMSDFALMGKRLGCDIVIYEPIMDWGVFAQEEFLQRAVHYASHPRYEEYLQQSERVREILPCNNSEDRIANSDMKTLRGGL
jgi:MoaA/NifB/PqqE/SkfB family radical SAM enzyme